MTDNVINFPNKPTTEKVHIIRVIDNIEYSLRQLYKSGVAYGRSQGFLIGSLFAGVVNLIFNFLMRHM